MSKNVYVVLSPPRCGSSCTARALQALGIDLGTDLMEAAPNNPKGFFEDNVVRKINDHLTEMFIRFNNGETSLNPMTSEIFTSACELLKNRFSNTEHFGFKEPRISRFLPFWQKVFEELNLNDNYIIAIRNPLCFAVSVQNSLIEKSLLMWVANLAPLVQATQNKKRIVVDYDHILDSPRKQLARISNVFDLSHLHTEKDIQLYCDEFLDKSLQHHKYTFEQLHSNAVVYPICIKIYAALLKVAEDKINFECDKFKAEWKKIDDHLEENLRLYNYIIYLMTKNEQYEAELEKAKQFQQNYERTLSGRISSTMRRLEAWLQAG